MQVLSCLVTSSLDLTYNTVEIEMLIKWWVLMLINNQNAKIKNPMETEPITNLPVAVFRNYKVNFTCFPG